MYIVVDGDTTIIHSKVSLVQGLFSVSIIVHFDTHVFFVRVYILLITHFKYLYNYTSLYLQLPHTFSYNSFTSTSPSDIKNPTAN